MTAAIYRFNVGAFNCMAVSDGWNEYPARLFFVNAPEDVLQHELLQRGLPATFITPYTCLLIDTGTHRVLVDTGMGGEVPTAGKLQDNLRAAEIAPESIDVVILSHGHADHVGGLTEPGGRPAFPNACCVLSKAEWDFWVAGVDKGDQMTVYSRSKLLPMQSRLALVIGEWEVVPGVRVIPTPGHTPGHLIVSVCSDAQELIYAGDLIAHPMHLEFPDWNIVADIDREKTIVARRQFLQNVAGGPLVFGYHFEFPGVGRVVRHEGTWHWVAADI